MLVVPGLVYKIILSAGLLGSNNCKLEFTGVDARLISKQGENLLLEIRQNNYLYYVSIISKAFK